MQIKTRMKYHLTPVRMANINKLTNNKYCLRIWRKGNSFVLLVGMQTTTATVENSMEIPQKIKNGSAFWPSDTTSGNIPKEIKILIWKNISTPMFIAGLFTITKIWNQPVSINIDQWLKQLWDIHTVEFYLAIKKKKVLPFSTIWMDLENIMLSKIISQRKTNTIWFHSYVESNEQTELTSKTETDS